tara:strand:+ start:6185 stop:6400 length:216 start_codon:yes stop_codon:yes gene_type:complete
MKTVSLFIHKSLEIFVQILALLIIASVVFPFEILPQILNYINTNPLTVLGLGLVYILYKTEYDEIIGKQTL